MYEMLRDQVFPMVLTLSLSCLGIFSFPFTFINVHLHSNIDIDRNPVISPLGSMLHPLYTIFTNLDPLQKKLLFKTLPFAHPMPQ